MSQLARPVANLDGTVEGRPGTVPCLGCGKSLTVPPRPKFRHYYLIGCPNCLLERWYPARMPSAAWHELTYQERDQSRAPLEPGHKFFLSDAQAPKSGKLLDIGCGVGNFLCAAREAGYKVTGIELNANAARFARENLHGRVYSLSLEDFGRQHGEEKFDVVTFFEVLEHQDQPRVFLEQAASCLTEDGWIALSVPNRGRWKPDFDVLDFPPNHLTRWNAETLRNFLSAGGFEVVTICEQALNAGRVAQVLSATLRTGMVARVVGEQPPTPTDLSEMSTEAATQTVCRLARSHRHWLMSILVRAKTWAMYPCGLLLTPFLRFGGYKGLYLYCLAKRKKRS